MSEAQFIRNLLLPELRFVAVHRIARTRRIIFELEKVSEFEVCPRCASKCNKTYDHRTVQVRDAPVRDYLVTLKITKRRLYCATCKKPFTEPIPGVRKGHRTTERLGRAVLWACENFSDLSKVKKAYGCSDSYIYKTLYRHLELQRRMRLYPWPETIGIDEHGFGKDSWGNRRFVTSIVDFRNHRVFELVAGKTGAELEAALAEIPGRHNVQKVVMDMCEPFRSFVRRFFPNARIVVDRFHVVRLLFPAIYRHLKALRPNVRFLPESRLLLKTGAHLSPSMRLMLRERLAQHPSLRELYDTKEALSALFRIRNPHQAKRAFIDLTQRMARSSVLEIQTCRRTLIRWKHEIILAFFTRLTNGLTEGFNNVAKLVQRRAFGYKQFSNYRLRFLNACA